MTPTHSDLDEFENRKCLPIIPGVRYPTEVDIPEPSRRHSAIIHILTVLYDRVAALAKSRNVSPDDIYMSDMRELEMSRLLFQEG